ncbi:hypothetical protein UlMin_017988 [Ulmus minor]
MAKILINPSPFLSKPPPRLRVPMIKLASSKEVKDIKMSHGVRYPKHPEKPEVWKSMEDWLRESVLPLLKPIDKSWQPQDLLPNPESEGFLDQVKEVMERAKEVPDEYFVVLVGDMITEEALPTYQSRLTILDGIRDESGVDDSPLAIWARGWSAEENRHGDLLNKYLYLSGRVNMKQVERTIHQVIASGANVGTGSNTYYGMIYTSFQERATFISHGNTAKLAKHYGDIKLAQICGTIAADEKRHEAAYTKIVGKLFELDPNGTIMAFADLMRMKVTMPAYLMYDGRDPKLYDHFSNVAARIGVYSAMDYVEIMEHFVAKWNVENLQGLSSEGQKAQDFVCGLAQRFRKLEERAQSVVKETKSVPFSWIFDKDVLA